MGFVDFAGLRVGFWIAERSQDPLAELPPGVVPEVVGAHTGQTRALVLCGIDRADQPQWATVLQRETGAALVIPWGDRLVAALGDTALFLDGQGRISGRFETTDELTGAATAGTSLVFLGRKTLSLVGPDDAVRWTAPVTGDALLLLEATAEAIRVVAFAGADWNEQRFETATGRLVQ